eukprot:CFRG5467T1
MEERTRDVPKREAEDQLEDEVRSSSGKKQLLSWKEFISEEELKVAEKVLSAFINTPGLKGCVQNADGEALKPLMILGRRMFAPNMMDKKKRLAEKRMKHKEKDLQIISTSNILKKKQLQKDMYMNALTPAADPLQLTSSVDDPIPACTPEPPLTITEASTPTVGSAASVKEVENEGLKDAPEEESSRMLRYPRKCCICGLPYQEVHVFYHKMCLKCGDFNFQKREETADLSDRIALVTGGRVKIGFYVALTLLRCGATVIVTTRFPQDAGVRFGREGDFATWKHRLFVYGLDFRDVAAVHSFTSAIKTKFQRLDILINNAAQTVRKPPGFYKHLMAGEAEPKLILKEGDVDTVDVDHLTVVSGFDPHRQQNQQLANIEQAPSSVLGSAAMSQMIVMAGDDVHHDDGTTLFPEGKLDADLQQIDLRKVTSWVQPLQDINIVEFVECQAINMMAPFILNSELKALLDRSPADDKYIVNVSAMEGYAKDSIYMTSVDTGWITDENPSHLLSKRTDPPPLDDIDAAQRILDPIYLGVKDPNNRLYGVFLKDYRVIRW